MPTAISIHSLSKQYRLGVLSHGVLFRDLQAWWARTRGKPDPNRRAPDFVVSADDQRRIEGSDKFWALQDINLDIQQGEAVGTLRQDSVQRIGRNGAGKSTLLKTLSRVSAPAKCTRDRSTLPKHPDLGDSQVSRFRNSPKRQPFREIGWRCSLAMRYFHRGEELAVHNAWGSIPGVFSIGGRQCMQFAL